MAKVDRDYVKKETMYIGIGVALVVGVLVGIVVNSSQSGFSQAPTQSKVSGPAQVQSGITSQQASQIMDLEQQVKANPQDVNAWTQLGHVYFDTNRVDQAIRAYSKSLELRPGDANVLTDLGVMYRRAGRFQEALATFDIAIAANPIHEQAKFNKGIVLMYDLGNVQAAVDVWTLLLNANPGATAANGTPISQIIADAKNQLPVNAGQ